MGNPWGIGIVDTMLGLPARHRRAWADQMAGTLRDAESRTSLAHPASYMYKDLPQVARDDATVRTVLDEMDRHGIEQALVPVDPADEFVVGAVRAHPDRFLVAYQLEPHRGAEAIRELKRVHDELGIAAATAFACGYVPIVPIDDPKMFPLYAACVELDLPVFTNAGVPGPRVPMTAQHVERLDTVCYEFPELRIVMRHGAEPWVELAVKLMIKWPNLHYSTSAFAPKHYPRAILDYANTRGADRIVYAGYYPYGLTLERIFSELPNVPLKDEVWPKFLRDNARRVMKLDR